MKLQLQKLSNSDIKIIGKKTSEQLESDWLTHFRSNSTPRGRPEGPGWLTCDEMAEEAEVDDQSMRRYLRCHEQLYEAKTGTKAYNAGERKVTFYRLIIGKRSPAVLQPA